MSELKSKPKVTNSLAEQELDKAEEQFKAYDDNIKELTLDRMNEAPKREVEPQTKLSQRDLDKSNHTYLKPSKSIGCRDKFNEKYRKDYEFDKEYVQFIAENKEITGDTIDIWTRPYGGMAAEYWNVPPNKPVWGPRYLAEQIKRCRYHRLVQSDSMITGTDGIGHWQGGIVVDSTIQRLDAIPVSQKKSVFMGASDW